MLTRQSALKVTLRKRTLSKELRQRSNAPEKLAWHLLRDRRCLGLKFRRQQVLRGYVVDFFCPQHCLVIEIDGASHIGREQHDALRQQALEAKGLSFLRITTDELMSCPEIVEKRIREFLGE